MERKGSSTAVVTKEVVAKALKNGATVDLRAPLPQVQGSDELMAELELIEMTLLRGLKAHRGQSSAGAAVKSKIAAKLSRK